MSLLGKILVFLNLLGAVGLTVVAAMDYGKRQTWEHAVFRQDLFIKGLPLSEQDAAAANLSTDLLREVFNQAGSPVKTQTAEVERLRQIVEGAVGAAGTDQKKLAEIARVLLPFATSNLQRERLLAYRTHLIDDKAAAALKGRLTEAVANARKAMANDKDMALKFPEAFSAAWTALPGEPARPFTEALVQALTADPSRTFDFEGAVAAQFAAAKGQLDGMFADALASEKTLPEGGNKERPTDEHRRVIAHLLFNLVEVLPAPDAPAAEAPAPAAPRDLFEIEGYRRFVSVVGLQSAIREINAEASLLGPISRELALEIVRDRSTFALSHHQLLTQVKELAEKADRAKADQNRAVEQATAQEALVAKRKKDVAEAKKELDDLRLVTAARVKELRNMSRALYNIRIEVRDATAENQQRVKKIEELERNAGK